MATPMETSAVSSPARALPTIRLPPQDLQQSLDETLPDPETFDILPALHELLSRLLPYSDDTSRPPTYSDQQPLSPQQLQQAASAIKNKIRKAKQAVSALPGIERSVEEQNSEMEDLHAKIERQKQVLRNLGGG